jgi:hypothetical protein
MLLAIFYYDGIFGCYNANGNDVARGDRPEVDPVVRHHHTKGFLDPPDGVRGAYAG